MSSRIGRRGVWRWPVAAILLVCLAACQGEASTPAPSLSAASPAVEQTAAGAAFDSTLVPSESPSKAPADSPTGPPATQPETDTPSPVPTATTFLLPTASPTPTEPPSTPLPSATPDCEDGLLYLEDLTIPDGTVVSPGARIDKRWRVQNSGSCNWDGRYRLRQISGPELGLSADQALYPARSGVEAVIRLLLTAPTEPGAYRSAWQAVDPLGQPFGDPIFVEIIVATSNP